MQALDAEERWERLERAVSALQAKVGRLEKKLAKRADTDETLWLNRIHLAYQRQPQRTTAGWMQWALDHEIPSDFARRELARLGVVFPVATGSSAEEAGGGDQPEG